MKYIIALLSLAALSVSANAENWTVRSPLNVSRYAHAAATVNGKVYVVGGASGSGVVNDLGALEEYDPATDTWTLKQPMPTPRSNLAAAVVNGKLYVLGGNSFGTYGLPTNEEYDPATDTWTTKAPMPTGRSNLSAVAINGKVYAVGGLFGGSGPPHDTVEEYDPATNMWTTKAPMPTARLSLGAAAVNGKLYAVGGYTPAFLATNEEYDPATDTWTTKAPMLTGRSDLAVAAIDDKLYALGGSANGGVPANEEYDPVTNTWVTKEPAPPRWATAAAAVDGAIYITGGSSGPGDSLQTTENDRYDAVTPPILNLPVNITVDATSPSGSGVTYSASATDEDGPVPIECTPPSASTFAIGVSVVDCEATNEAGTTSGTFQVLVQGAAAQVANLTATVQSFNSVQGITNSLDAKLAAVASALSAARAGALASECNQLNAFINQTQAQSGTQLTVDEANQLLMSADRIKAVIGCP